MTITEAVITNTPLIVQKSKGMAPVQKENEEWLLQTGTGIVAATPAKIAAAVTEIVNNPAYKQRMAQQNHQAVFQIADYIERIGKLNQIHKPISHVTT